MNAREAVNEAKNKVKPGVKPTRSLARKKRARKRRRRTPIPMRERCYPRDLSHTEPSDGAVFSAFSSFSDAGSAGPQSHSSESGIAGFTPGLGSTEVMVIDELSDLERTELSARLEEYYVAGRISVTDDPAKCFVSWDARWTHYGSRGRQQCGSPRLAQGALRSSV